MKYMKKIAVIGMSLFVLGGIGLTIAAITTNDWNTYEKALTSKYFKFEEKKVVDNPSEEIKISTDLHDTAVQIEDSASNHIEIMYSYNDEKYPINVTEKNDEIEITRKKPFFNFSNIFTMNRELAKVIVKLPASYNGELFIETRNQVVKADGVNVKNLHVRTTNGKVQLDTIESKGAVNIVTTNEKIQVESLQASKDVSFKTTNASVSLDNLHTNEKVAVDSTNGSLNISNVKGKELTGETTNDRLNVNRLIVQGVILLESTNGKITIEQITSGGEVRLNTTNDRVYVKDVKAQNIAIETTNADLEGLDVYGKNVELRSTNGDLILTNMANPSFTIDTLKTRTNNGSEIINAKYNQMLK